MLNFNIKIICVLDKNKKINNKITKIQMGSSNLFADFSSYQSVLWAAVIHISADNCILKFIVFFSTLSVWGFYVYFNDNLESNYINRNTLFSKCHWSGFLVCTRNVKTLSNTPKSQGLIYCKTLNFFLLIRTTNFPHSVKFSYA